MTTATLTTPEIRPVSRDAFFLAVSIGITAILVALVVLDGHVASAALIVGGFALGAAFLKFEFSYTASWRRFLSKGEAGGLIGGLIVIAVTALAVVPLAALSPGYGGAIAPIGPSLLIGSFAFGVGMQLANACGSGTLYTAGGGSGRMLIALAMFIVGSVLGSLSLPPALRLGGIDPVLAKDYFGAWGGLFVTLASIALVAAIIAFIAKRRGANWVPPKSYIIGGLIIGALCVAVFLAGRHPWSVTFGYTVWGGKIVSALGIDLSQFEFWQWEGPKRALRDSVLSDTSSLTDFGMILGAMAAAAASKPFARTAWPPAKSLIAAALGGLICGWGARLGFGCNIGAFIGGVGSGSLHGWIWFVMALAGCWVGMRIRPLFGLSRD